MPLASGHDVMNSFQPVSAPVRARPGPAGVRPQLARQRLEPAWQQAVAGCRGLQGLLLHAAGRQPDMKLLQLPQVWHLHAVSPERLEGSLICDVRAWPFLPGSIDAVFWVLDEAHLPLFPLLLAELTLLLGPSGRLVIQAEAPMLDEWVRVGMPLCRHHGLVLGSETWGDSRRLLHLPLRRYWSEGLQCWFPGVAQWTVQCWQKESLCPPRRQRQPQRGRSGWRTDWAPQTRNPVHKEYS